MLNCILLFILVGSTVCECKRPNFVIFMTDDQDVVLDGMSPMKNVHHYIQDQGITFTNSFTTSPICCPSRASFLTGLYVHNHGTYNNSRSGGCHGDSWTHHEDRTFVIDLKKAGYSTFYAGKYLNQYGTKASGGPERIPAGWSEWHGLVGNSVYYNYTLSNNGVPTYSDDLYLTDVIRDLSVSYIDNLTQTSPFLLFIAPPAPHQPFTPASRHLGKFNNVTAVRRDNFNVSCEDKHWLLRMSPSPLPSDLSADLDHVYRSRWESLLAVDELVAQVVEKLTERGLLDDTYVLFTSDNGYHIGQFSQVYDKRQPYETDIRVPLTIRGPGIQKNVRNNNPILNIDLAPTILTLAGLTPPKHMDGSPIELKQDGFKERFMLVEYYGEGNENTVDKRCSWYFDGENLSECHPSYDCKCQDSRNNTYSCVRHLAERINTKYCNFTDDEQFVEIYDINEDPYELQNIVASTLPAIKHWYHYVLDKMSKCSGSEDCTKFDNRTRMPRKHG